MAIATRTVTYTDEKTALTGFLAWDDAARNPLPGLLLVHGGPASMITPRARPSATLRTATRCSRVTCSGAASPATVNG